MPASNFKEKILKVLKNEGYINDFSTDENNDKKKIFLINLKYKSGNPVITEMKRVSRPGRRIYARASSIPKINNGLGIVIISTSKGVMTDIDARKANLGGEIICRVF